MSRESKSVRLPVRPEAHQRKILGLLSPSDSSGHLLGLTALVGILLGTYWITDSPGAALAVVATWVTVLLLRQGHSRVVFDEEGIHIRRWFTFETIPWSDLSSHSVMSHIYTVTSNMGGGFSTRCAVLDLHLHDGRTERLRMSDGDDDALMYWLDSHRTDAHPEIETLIRLLDVIEAVAPRASEAGPRLDATDSPRDSSR